MVKIKEYPPVISVMTIIEDRLLGAKSYPTVMKRLKELKVRVFPYDMVKTEEFFKALLDEKEQSPVVKMRRSEPFKLPE